MPPRPPRSTLFPYTTLFRSQRVRRVLAAGDLRLRQQIPGGPQIGEGREQVRIELQDRKSTRLNSSHLVISYAVFCLKKKIRDTTSSLQHKTIHIQYRDQVYH